MRAARRFRWVFLLGALVGVCESAELKWTEAFPAGVWFEPTAMSGDGRVLVGRLIQNRDMEAVVWTEAEGFRRLGHLAPEPDWSSAWAVNFGGNVVVGTV